MSAKWNLECLSSKWDKTELDRAHHPCNKQPTSIPGSSYAWQDSCWSHTFHVCFVVGILHVFLVIDGMVSGRLLMRSASGFSSASVNTELSSQTLTAMTVWHGYDRVLTTKQTCLVCISRRACRPDLDLFYHGSLVILSSYCGICRHIQRLLETVSASLLVGV